MKDQLAQQALTETFELTELDEQLEVTINNFKLQVRQIASTQEWDKLDDAIEALLQEAFEIKQQASDL
jgi:hypothetical protein